MNSKTQIQPGLKNPSTQTILIAISILLILAIFISINNPSSLQIAGTCGVVSVITAESPKSNLLIDEPSIYFVSKDNILMRISTSGTEKIPLTATDAKSIAQDKSLIYFIDNSTSIKKIPKAGGNTTLILQLDSPATDINVDENYIYWIEAGTLKRIKK